MYRRQFITTGLGSLLVKGCLARACPPQPPRDGTARCEEGPYPPAYSVIPVVGDGHWVWTEPPQQTGYLEPRPYELKIGIQLQGTGEAHAIKATTPVPVNLPEQKIESTGIETQYCRATIRALSSEAAQLVLVTPSMARGQTITAVATMRLKLFKQHQGFIKEQFPNLQHFSSDVRKKYCGTSPGIQTRSKEVRKLAGELVREGQHPWDKAQAFHQWGWENIQARIGYFTSVVTAIRRRFGDCEERAAVFVALCRAVGIPARLVWVPNHNWAEFYLTDESDQGHWIPVHTAAYSWFGWTGAHELVIQKGDKLHVPEKRQPQRLLVDWMQWQGARPKVSYLAELVPLPPQPGSDAGPGARRKDAKGEWVLLGRHALDAQLRDGEHAASYGNARTRQKDS